MNKYCALLLIDGQQAFLDKRFGPRNNLNAEKQMSTLLNTFRHYQLPVIHVQHLSNDKDSLFQPGSSAVAFQACVQPLDTEKIIQKHVNSAFIGTDLHDYLQQEDIHTLVIAGLTTPHCVATTVRMSGNLGYETYLVSDATTAFDLVDFNGDILPAELVHHVSLATLHGEFATVIETENVLQLLKQLEK